MTERRSIGAALDITPEKLAFIHGQSKEIPSPAHPPPTKAKEETIDIDATPTAQEANSESAPSKSRRSPRNSIRQAPGDTEVLNQLLVPLTIRVPRRIAQSLKRAYLEQRLNSAKPDTQQEIVQEALSSWLSANGF